MPTKGVSMRKIKTLWRLHHESQLSQHQIAKSLQLSVGIVNKCLKRAKAAGLSWPLPADYDDEGLLKKRLQGVAQKPSPSTELSDSDFAYIHQERKRKNVTLQLLWEEYRTTVLTSVSYSHFCLLYRNYKNTQPQSMRQTHKGGDKAFVDYAGQTVDIHVSISIIMCNLIIIITVCHTNTLVKKLNVVIQQHGWNVGIKGNNLQFMYEATRKEATLLFLSICL